MLIAVDHGNHAIKTVHHNFVSGLARHSVRPPMADEVLSTRRNTGPFPASVFHIAGIRPGMKVSSFSPCLLSQKSFLPMPVTLPAAEKIELAVGLPRNTTAF